MMRVKKKVVAIPDLDVRVGIAIKRMRQQEGLTQKDLADRLGVSQPSISLAERGRRNSRLSLKMFQQIANVFGLKLSQLISFAEDIGSLDEALKKAEVLCDKLS